MPLLRKFHMNGISLRGIFLRWLLSSGTVFLHVITYVSISFLFMAENYSILSVFFKHVLPSTFLFKINTDIYTTLNMNKYIYFTLESSHLNRSDIRIPKVKVKSESVSHVLLWDPRDGSLPGFSVHGILQARILAWVAISFSRGCFRPKDRTGVFSIAGRFFTIWATREARNLQVHHNKPNTAGAKNLSFL